MNSAGIDFGTSNCTAGWMNNGQAQLALLEGESAYLSSALYVQRQPAPVDDDCAYLNQSLHLLLQQQAPLYLGQAAHTQYSQNPLGGVFIRSPKSMLGSRLTAAQSLIYQQVCSLLLKEIRSKAMTQGNTMEYAVLGRPIHFQGIDGVEGDRRAEAILQQAAQMAGFKEIQFAYEPVAAAMEFERTLSQEQLVLVVDIGGGTSDISLVRLCPRRMQQHDRSQDLLSHAGKRIGGIDMDIKLAIYSLMPLLGRGSLALSGRPLPHALFSDAVQINDIQAQEHFYRPQTAAEITALQQQARDPRLLNRLALLYQNHLSYYLVQTAEQAKITLSAASEVVADLARLEPDLKQIIRLTQLESAIYQELHGIKKLIAHCLQQAGSKPDCIFLTGGASSADGIQQVITSILPSVPLITGDRFGSVGKGLCRLAERYFR